MQLHDAVGPLNKQACRADPIRHWVTVSGVRTKPFLAAIGGLTVMILCGAATPLSAEPQSIASSQPASLSPAAASETNDAAYRETIRKRAEGIVAALKLDSPEASQKTQEALEAFYPQVSAWHDANGPTLKSLRQKLKDAADTHVAEATKAEIARIESTRIQIIAALEERLVDVITAEQIMAIKDQMTFNRVAQMTGIFAQLDLTPEQATEIRSILELAREEAVTAGSSEAKHAVFRRYIGRINSRVLTEAQRDRLAEIQKPKK
jgi:hypothetical protein